MPEPAQQHRKLEDIQLDEISGVDEPAHLERGWLLMKNASPETVGAILEKAERMEKEHQALTEALEGAANGYLADAPDQVKAAANALHGYLGTIQHDGPGATDKKPAHKAKDGWFRHLVQTLIKMDTGDGDSDEDDGPLGLGGQDGAIPGTGPVAGVGLAAQNGTFDQGQAPGAESQTGAWPGNNATGAPDTGERIDYALHATDGTKATDDTQFTDYGPKGAKTTTATGGAPDLQKAACPSCGSALHTVTKAQGVFASCIDCGYFRKADAPKADAKGAKAPSMACPKCGTTMQKGGTCPKCGYSDFANNQKAPAGGDESNDQTMGKAFDALVAEVQKAATETDASARHETIQKAVSAFLPQEDDVNEYVERLTKAIEDGISAREEVPTEVEKAASTDLDTLREVTVQMLDRLERVEKSSRRTSIEGQEADPAAAEREQVQKDAGTWGSTVSSLIRNGKVRLG